MLLSGVVRRKVAQVNQFTSTSNSQHDKNNSSPASTSVEGNLDSPSSSSFSVLNRMWMSCHLDSIFKSLTLRVHKFSLQWDLFFHLSILMMSMTPFTLTGNRIFATIPIGVWAIYNILFLIGPRRANQVVPGFIILSLTSTGHELGGPPICFDTCDVCLSTWSASVKMDEGEDRTKHTGCGYSNGRELLGVYTMAQTAFVLFFTVVIGLAICMAWKAAPEELEEKQAAEDWLKSEDTPAYNMRESIILKCGSPASPVRPEANATWVFFGLVAALSFILMGWHSWFDIPPSKRGALLIILNILIKILSILLLHLGFFGRLLALYKRNFDRVAALTSLVHTLNPEKIDAWWNCRSFVLNEDLSLDYDIGGLGMAAFFLLMVSAFVVAIEQISREGYVSMMEAPGSYCSYGCMYLTLCFIRIFTIATSTFEEQQRHILGLQKLSVSLLKRGASTAFLRSASEGYLNEYPEASLPPSGLSTMSKPKDVESNQYESYDVHYTESDPLLFESGNASTGLPDLNLDNISSNEIAPPTTLSQSSSFLKTNQSQSSTATNSLKIKIPASNSINESSNQLGYSASTNNMGGFASPGGSKSKDNSIMKAMSYDVDDKSHSMSMVGSPSLRAKKSFITGPSPRAPSIPRLTRNISGRGTVEANRQDLADMIEQIKIYDPYPCILGMPVMPALFNTCKFYIFIGFAVVGCRVMIPVFRQMFLPLY